MGEKKSSPLFNFLNSINFDKNDLSEETTFDKEYNPFIINRFNYHSIPAWLVSTIKRVPIIFDMDDWETERQKARKQSASPTCSLKEAYFA